MNPGQDAPGAELLGTLRIAEPAAKGEPLGLQADKAHGDVALGQPGGVSQLGGGRRASVLEMPTEHLGHRLVPVRRSRALGQAQVGLERRSRVQDAEGAPARAILVD